MSQYTSPTAHIRANCYDDADITTNPQGPDLGDYHASVSIFRTYVGGITNSAVLDHIEDIRACLEACKVAVAHHEAMENKPITLDPVVRAGLGSAGY